MFSRRKDSVKIDSPSAHGREVERIPGRQVEDKAHPSHSSLAPTQPGAGSELGSRGAGNSHLATPGWRGEVVRGRWSRGKLPSSTNFSNLEGRRGCHAGERKKEILERLIQTTSVLSSGGTVEDQVAGMGERGEGLP